jgi:hypothetical protein
MSGARDWVLGTGKQGLGIRDWGLGAGKHRAPNPGSRGAEGAALLIFLAAAAGGGIVAADIGARGGRCRLAGDEDSRGDMTGGGGGCGVRICESGGAKTGHFRVLTTLPSMRPNACKCPRQRN